jgi:hypothetical protein
MFKIVIILIYHRHQPVDLIFMLFLSFIFYIVFYGHDFTYYYYLNCYILRNLIHGKDRYSDPCFLLL